jgi:hypothetical protein
VDIGVCPPAGAAASKAALRGIPVPRERCQRAIFRPGPGGSPPTADIRGRRRSRSFVGAAHGSTPRVEDGSPPQVEGESGGVWSGAGTSASECVAAPLMHHRRCLFSDQTSEVRHARAKRIRPQADAGMASAASTCGGQGPSPFGAGDPSLRSGRRWRCGREHRTQMCTTPGIRTGIDAGPTMDVIDGEGLTFQ